MRFGQLRQAHARGAPAAVAQGALERWLADHVAGQAHGGGVETGVQRDAAAFGFGAHGLDGEVLAQHLGAAFMHDAGGRADVGIGIAGQAFLREVDQARFALQQGQQLQGGVRRGFAQRGWRRCRGGGRRGRRRYRRGGRHRGRALLDAGGEFGVAEGLEERAEGEGNPAPERRQVVRCAHFALDIGLGRACGCRHRPAEWRIIPAAMPLAV